MPKLSDLIPGNPLSTEIQSIERSHDRVKLNSLFFAIRGAQHDGHAYVADALNRGAAYAVIEDPTLLRKFPNRTILVPSTRAAWAMASVRWWQEPTKSLNVIGITGTNGKTTSALILRQLLQASGIGTGAIGTVMNDSGRGAEAASLTTPDAWDLQRMFSEMVETGLTHAVMEVTSIALDQHRVWGTEFQSIAFTNLTHDHLDYHRDMESYGAAKRKLFDDYQWKVAVINTDDRFGSGLNREISGSKLTLGLEASADIMAEDLRFHRAGVSFQLKSPWGTAVIRSRLMGRHNIYNALTALALALNDGQPLDALVEAMASIESPRGRLEPISIGAARPLVLVDFAHTEDGLRQVLLSLREMVGIETDRRIITVFGCGGDRDQQKRPVMGQIAAELSDIVIVTSDNPRTESPEAIVDAISEGITLVRKDYHREVDRRKAIQLALQLATPTDIVLISGKGHETYQIIGKDRLPFDDKKVVEEYYNNI